MKIVYIGSYREVDNIYGVFRKNEPRDIPEDQARQLLKGDEFQEAKETKKEVKK